MAIPIIPIIRNVDPRKENIAGIIVNDPMIRRASRNLQGSLILSYALLGTYIK